MALSIVCPADDPRLRLELKKLRRYLPQKVAILVGGRAADAYAKVLERIKAIRTPDLPGFRAVLESLRLGHKVR
jgi:hypothetical protein